MKKIMFNDKYGLTKAVLDGSKTMTMRIVPQTTHMYLFMNLNWQIKNKMTYGKTNR